MSMFALPATMITARIRTANAPPFDAELVEAFRQQRRIVSPGSVPYCRFGLRGHGGSVYRIVIGYSDVECLQIIDALNAVGLGEQERSEDAEGFDSVYGPLWP